MDKNKGLQSVASLVAGGMFAVGLGISGMTQPQKVIGFLEWGAGWDSSLLFVMLGAVAFHGLSYRLIRGRASPLLDTKWHVPETREITISLMLGSLIFGLGWGLGGYCPGPGLTALASGSQSAIIFVVSMIAGMFLHRLLIYPGTKDKSLRK
jgi:uncharacterized membrane protein YedE/YeeE